MTAEQVFADPKFNAKVDEQKWWYTSLVTEFQKSKVAPELVRRLGRAVNTIFS